MRREDGNWMSLSVLDWKKFCKPKLKEIRVIICLFINLIMAITYADIKTKVFNYEYSEWLNIFSVTLVIWFLAQELSLLLLGVKRNIIAIVFVLFVYLFYFSHIFLLAIEYDYGVHYNDFAVIRYGEEIYIQSMHTALNLTMALYYGILLASIIGQQVKYKKKVNCNQMNTMHLGGLILCMTVPVFILGIIRFFDYVSVYGYAFAANNAGYDINTYAYMRMSLVGFVLCMLSCKKEKNARRLIFAASIVYFFAMFSGQRAYNLMFILILFFLYFIRFKEMRISPKMILFAFVGAVVLIQAINLIRNTRASGMNLSLLWTNLIEQSSNPVLDLLREFGITENAIVYTYMNQDNPIGGMQFLTSFLVAVPGIAELFPHINYSALNVSDALDMWNFGGALVSDVIFDFGRNAYVVCFFIGFVLQKFYEYFLSIVYRRKVIVAAFLSPLLCEAIFCVRSTAYKIPRLIFMYGIFLFIFVFFYTLLKISASINWERGCNN